MNDKTKSSHKNYYYVFLDTIITSITTLNNGPLQQVDTEVDFISIRARISFNPLLICFTYFCFGFTFPCRNNDDVPVPYQLPIVIYALTTLTRLFQVLALMILCFSEFQRVFKDRTSDTGLNGGTANEKS